MNISTTALTTGVCLSALLLGGSLDNSATDVCPAPVSAVHQQLDMAYSLGMPYELNFGVPTLQQQAEILLNFSEELLRQSVDVKPEYAQVLNDNIFELL